MSPESRMMNPGNARTFLNYSLFIFHFSLFIIHCPLFIINYSFFIVSYKGKISTPVSAHVDI